jgi:dolichol-phosphate mannosyltransferase
MQTTPYPKLTPLPPNSLRYSIVIPAYNESQNIVYTVSQLVPVLRAESIPFELIIVNDNSTDDTGNVVGDMLNANPEILLVHNPPPGGFGRAIRCGLAHVTGDAVAIVMADLSDSPDDVVRYYRKLEEGYDCVFGSRFIPGSKVSDYPRIKLVVQRIVNNVIRVMFSTRHNDMTNAFKAYRKYVIDDISPLRAAHFNITIELSLSTLIRQYTIATIPISWEGRTWGQSNLRLRAMGRRYLATLLKIWFERALVLDDLLQETEAKTRESMNNDKESI